PLRSLNQGEIIMEVLKSCVLLNYSARQLSAVREISTLREGAKVEKKGVVLFNPKKLNPFQRLKREMFTCARKYGTKLEALGAWLVPLDRADAADEEFKRLVQQYEDAAVDFCAEYRDLVDAQCIAHPLDAEDIRGAAPADTAVREVLRASCVLYQLPEEIRETGLERELDSLPGQVASEMAQDLRDSLGSGHRYTRDTLNVIRRVAKKAGSFGFLHPSLAAVPGLVDGLLSRLPPDGPYRGEEALNIGVVIAFLQDPARLLAEGENLGEDLFVKATDLLPEQDEAHQGTEAPTPTEAVVVSIAEMASAVDMPARGPVDEAEDVDSWF
ncbi:MAG: DUF3150 domain-containing protein, partial [Halothiobacillaceae bacterium]